MTPVSVRQYLIDLLTELVPKGDYTEWEEVAENRYQPSLVQGIAINGGESVSNGLLFSDKYRGLVIPVTPGQSLSIRRGWPLTTRFRGCWALGRIAPGTPVVHAFGGDSLALIEGLVAPAGAAWLVVYLSPTPVAVPRHLIVDQDTALEYFDGDTPDTDTDEYDWLGEPGMSASTHQHRELAGDGWQVRAGLLGIDNLVAPALAVWTADVAPGPAIGVRMHSLRVRLLSPTQDPETVDDELDDDLATLLGILDTLDPITWETAERGMHADTYHAYTVTVTVPARKDA